MGLFNNKPARRLEPSQIPLRYCWILTSFLLFALLPDRDAFDEDPEVMSFPLAVVERQPEHCATAQKRVGEEKLAERLEDVDVI